MMKRKVFILVRRLFLFFSKTIYLIEKINYTFAIRNGKGDRMNIKEKLLKDRILNEHNFEPYIKLKRKLENSDKALMIQAPRTGKTFIIFQLMYDNPEELFLYLVPDEEIENQYPLYISWLGEEAQKSYFNVKFSQNVKIMTYEAILQMTQKELEQLKLDYLILDEVHHLHNHILKDKIECIMDGHSKLKIIGMTATPETIMDQENHSMIFDEQDIASIYLLDQAVADHVLTVPNYVSFFPLYPIYEGHSHCLLRELQTREEMIKSSTLSTKEKDNCLLLLQQIQKEIPQDVVGDYLEEHGKYLVFCSEENYEKIKNGFSKYLQDVVCLKDMTIYVVSGDQEFSRRQADNFYHDNDTSKFRILFTTDMYAEGVQLLDINGVILTDKVSSYGAFYQKIARAFTSGKKAKNSKILDFGNNYEYILELERKIKEAKGATHELEDTSLFHIETQNTDIYQKLLDLDKKERKQLIKKKH